jgi:hypothetical protein
MERQRTALKRCPGVLTDWSGNFLDKRILNHIRVGNVVRVSFVDAVKREQNNTVYFEIIRKCKKNPNWFVGVCKDPYYGDQDWFLLRNGDERAFSIHHITEIPLTWKNNQNLAKNAKTYNKRRTVTGAIY